MHSMTRRGFAMLAGAAAATSANVALAQEDKDKPTAPTGPTESPFERDYDAPSFKTLVEEASNQSHTRARFRNLRPL